MWFPLGFSLAALAMGYGCWSGDDEPTDPKSSEDPVAHRPTSVARSLKTIWNRAFWANPFSLVIVAIVTTPLGGFIVGPVLAGRAAEIWGGRAGYEHSFRLGIAVGVLWFAVFFLGFALLASFW